MTRFGGADGGFDGFQVAHFTDQNHVRVLTQHASERFRERRYVDTKFALIHH